MYFITEVLGVGVMFAKIMGKLSSSISAGALAKAWSMWAPFRGAKISVDHISEDYKQVDVSMKLGIKNRNIVGTHFGGSLYAMTDPFYMVMLMKILGKEYIVWDKSANIKFKKPGRSKVRALYRLTDDDIQFIKDQISKDQRRTCLWNKKVEILDEQDEIVAEVDKVVYIKKKA